MDFLIFEEKIMFVLKVFILLLGSFKIKFGQKLVQLVTNISNSIVRTFCNFDKVTI